MSNQKPLSGDLLDYGDWSTDGLVYLGLFNEGSGNKVFDLSGNGNTLTINNDYLWSPGKFGGTVELLGVTDFITGDSAKIINGMTAITMSIWFNMDSIITQMLIRLEQVGLTINLDGGITYILYTPDLDGGGPGRSTYSVTAGTWYHVVVTQDASNNYAVYVDGVLIQSGSTIALDLTGSERLLIGALNQTGTWDFDGKLDNISIYNRALSASKVAELYREPFRMIRTKRRRIIYDGVEVAPPTTSPYYYREIASRRIA